MSRRPFPTATNGRQPQRKGHARGGAEGKRHWLWGTHPVLAALANPDRACRRLLLTAEVARQQSQALTCLISEKQGLHPETVDRPALASLLPEGAVHQGIAIEVEPLPEHMIEDLLSWAEGRESAIIVVLDQITDPHNVGAILRSAAAFGALGVVAPDRNAPDETGTLAKSASGALERLPVVHVTNLARALDQLKAGGFWVAGLDGGAETTLAGAKLSGKTALVLGAEGEGLRRLTREHCDLLVKLPQTDLVESLNVSNAAAVALYELVRR